MKDREDNAIDELVLDDRALLERCEIDFYRSHGPGGQKRNKTSSAVRLRHRSTGLIVTAVEDRSQHTNKARAIKRMREAIAREVRTPVDLANYSPSLELHHTIIGRGAHRVGRREVHHCMVVRELLDLLAASKMRLAEAAEKIGVPTAQVVKFLHKDPKLWKQVNQMRLKAKLKPLK